MLSQSCSQIHFVLFKNVLVHRGRQDGRRRQGQDMGPPLSRACLKRSGMLRWAVTGFGEDSRPYQIGWLYRLPAFTKIKEETQKGKQKQN